LSYLQALPFHVLKIDRSFTQQISSNPTQPSKTAITRAIVNLGNTLGLGVVAEGIEAWEQVTHLKAWDCPHGQGYLFSYPLNQEETTTFLQNHQEQAI
jgi:EAL domain-containing protein (putative c-di-GMP-specific phosphodiesterase class I)